MSLFSTGTFLRTSACSAGGTSRGRTSAPGSGAHPSGAAAVARRGAHPGASSADGFLPPVGCAPSPSRSAQWRQYKYLFFNDGLDIDRMREACPQPCACSVPHSHRRRRLTRRGLILKESEQNHTRPRRRRSTSWASTTSGTSARWTRRTCTTSGGRSSGEPRSAQWAHQRQPAAPGGASCSGRGAWSERAVLAGGKGRRWAAPALGAERVVGVSNRIAPNPQDGDRARGRGGRGSGGGGRCAALVLQRPGHRLPVAPGATRAPSPPWHRRRGVFLPDDGSAGPPAAGAVHDGGAFPRREGDGAPGGCGAAARPRRHPAETRLPDGAGRAAHPVRLRVRAARAPAHPRRRTPSRRTWTRSCVVLRGGVF